MREVKTGKIFWGIFLLLAAVFLIVSQMGLVEGVGVLSILFAIFWTAQLIAGIVKLSFGRILFSLAFLAIIFDKPLGIEAITPWTVLGAALLGTIGLNLIFRKKKKWHYEANYFGDKTYSYHSGGKTYVDGEVVEETAADAEEAKAEEARGSGQQGESGDSRFFIKNSFGEATKYIDTEQFEYAAIECRFGEMKVYLDKAVIRNGKAVIDLDVSFGSLSLYVPAHWKIINKMSESFGNVEERNQSRSDGSTVVVLNGSVSFGGAEIIYI